MRIGGNWAAYLSYVEMCQQSENPADAVSQVGNFRKVSTICAKN